MRKNRVCENCGGTGMVENYLGTDCDVKVCRECKGTGIILEEVEVEFDDWDSDLDRGAREFVKLYEDKEKRNERENSVL